MITIVIVTVIATVIVSGSEGDKLQSDTAVRFDARFGFTVVLRCGAMQILVVKKSMARWVTRLCLRVFRCCSVRLKPQ